ncbi:MAG TPA: TonB-dependent receptor plug domain-containing protein, partial [Sphingobacteriaceae bacterium]
MLKIYKNAEGSWHFPLYLGIVMLIFLVSLTPEQALSQTKLIRGTVTEAPAGVPLPGVSVRVKGSGTGTTTAANGNYTIQAKSTDVLVFTFLGLKPQEVTVGTKTTINVSLQSDATSLSEVVVIGYGQVAKPDLTGSVGVVPVEDMAKAPVGSFAEALAGRVAGVRVNATDGQPGGEVNIVIRGAGSLTQNTSPLYVIDGFPVEDPDPSTLNPEEIESMTILKDASSTAIYGSRAANGVILIQTKRGKVGKPV